MEEPFKTLEYQQDSLHLLDQRFLPLHRHTFICRTFEDVASAIRDMVVRGAPAIGVSAAYGVLLAARQYRDIYEKEGAEAFRQQLGKACAYLDSARPTAVNLHWALERMLRLYDQSQYTNIDEVLESFRREADAIRDEDVRVNTDLSRIGNAVIPHKATILTHCNAGALATAGWGTALGVIKEAHRSGKNIFVYADETRPRFQGARLTSWELMQANIPCTLIADSVAATLIRDGVIDLVIVGADRVATNGDVCNKIGTFMLSALCKLYGVPFYSAVPISTIDFSLASGDQIPIEQRDSKEVTHVAGVQIACDGVPVYNPAFDITPHQHVSGIITELGIIYPPFVDNIATLKRERI